MRLPTVMLVLVLVPGAGCLSIDYGLTGDGGGGSAAGGEGGEGATGGMGGDGGAGAAGGFAPCEGSCVAVPSDVMVVTFPPDALACVGAPVLGGRYISPDDAPFFTPAPTCECECEPPESACPPANVQVYQNTSDCTDTPTAVSMPAGTCSTVPAAKRSAAFATGVMPTGLCELINETEVLPPVEWASPIAACADELETCEGGLCVPPETVACIVLPKSGDCPAEFPFGDDVVLETSLEDTRFCDCLCNQVGGLCDTRLSLYTDTACLNDIATVGGTCQAPPASGTFQSLRYDPPLQCNPGTSTGGTVGYTPNRLCCTN